MGEDSATSLLFLCSSSQPSKAKSRSVDLVTRYRLRSNESRRDSSVNASVSSYRRDGTVFRRRYGVMPNVPAKCQHTIVSIRCAGLHLAAIE